MKRSIRKAIALRLWGVALLAAIGSLTVGIAPRAARAERVVLKDGRVLDGMLGSISGVSETPGGSSGGEGPAVKTIEVIDNNLTRTFVPHSEILRPEPDRPQLALQKITIKQQVAPPNVDRVGLIGTILKTDPFDDFGRRIISLAAPKGPINVVQGITEITPVYTRVQGLMGMHPYYWDMRIATSSIPRETLYRILSNTKVIDPKNLDSRTKLVRLLLDSERYGEAEGELAAIVRDFPKEEGLEKEVRAIRQLQARQVIREITLRRNVGQFELGFQLLQNFPREKVAGETLQQVAQMLDQYAEMQKHSKELLEGIEKNLAGINDPAIQKQAKPAVEEIKSELNFNTLDSLVDYSQQLDNAELSDDQKLSLAISGWLLGANHATPNLAVALGLFDVRDLARKYLSEANRNQRKQILAELRKKEANSCEMVAMLLDHMTPPGEVPSASESTPGFYEFEVAAKKGDEQPVSYYLQLPPEYDPHRRYPLVITLRGAGTTALQQLDWWAGAADAHGARWGQSMRHGYIVMAVDWARPDQQAYEFTEREHATVLVSLRHACRRFSIDTDRVYLSGHSMGGSAAWDLGVAHPDLWAGVIPIVAVADHYCLHYTDNASLVPFYIVEGELDGAHSKEQKKSTDTVLDRYLKGRYDTTLIQYQGRGHEHFYEEIQNIFDWMGRRKRDFNPKKIAAATMRPWDYSFWWLEVGDLPKNGVVDPIDWPPKRGFQPVRVDASIGAKTIFIHTGADRVTVWLNPELVDFSKPVKIDFKGKQLNHTQLLTPDVKTLLDDALARGDRQHPFWVKVE